MTTADSEGSPQPEPQPETAQGQDDAAGAPASRSQRGRWLRRIAVGITFVLLVSAGVGWSLLHKLEDNITTDTGTAEVLERYDEERPEPVVLEAKNILIIGSDSRDGGNAAYGEDSGTARSDTAILLHLAADRDRATAISLPRDLMVTVPSCPRQDSTGQDGGQDGTEPESTEQDGAERQEESTEERLAQFNWAYQVGGAACTIRTVEKLTGIRIDHHLVIDFQGFKEIVNAVGGVEVCLPEPVTDRDAKLDLPAGRQTLEGEDALGYVRARHALGNGSDTQRMTRQQEFLASLFQKVRSNGVLMNPAKLYPVLDAATSALTADEGLNSLTELYDVVRGVRDVPAERVTFLTVPRQPHHLNPNRDELVQPDADRLFAMVRDDEPVDVSGNDPMPAGGEDDGRGGGTAADGADPSPSPTYRGSTAATDSCD
ncbi:LCP family protein [Streptomyces sp. TRM 70351]|nr:LCP family protein [Streptomyces sp. TRM 70351]MEE1929326.1 LCP family protein [Streptomyces sp. TRM 70351]